MLNRGLGGQDGSSKGGAGPLFAAGRRESKGLRGPWAPPEELSLDSFAEDPSRSSAKGLGGDYLWARIFGEGNALPRILRDYIYMYIHSKVI